MAPVMSRTHLWETVLAGKWSNLGDAALQSALESAFASGSDGYQFKARGFTYDIDFTRMKQVNLKTKRERNLRRVPDPRASSAATAAVLPASAAAVLPASAAAVLPASAATVLPARAAVAPKTAPSPTPAVAPKTAPRSVKATVPAPAATAWTGSAKAAPVAAPPPVVPAATPLLVVPATTPVKPVKKPLPHQGKVKTFFKEKNYGFIVLDDGTDVFFHITAVSEFIDDSIRANDTVEVAVATSGKPRALEVRAKRRGSIFRQMCTNKCCRDKGDRHFEDRCPLKRKR